MGKVERHPAALPPAPAVMAILSRYDRDQLDAFIQIAIDLTNTIDGDPDLELDGDEQDGDFAEDEPCAAFAELGDGPGCSISDNDAEHDGSEQQEGH